MIPNAIAASILQSGLIPTGTRMQVFNQIYWVFLGLGTLVGVVVVGYMLKNAYTYRYRGGADDDDDRPKLGEMPTGGGKGKKLFLSFSLSAVIVISLIAWTYGTLLYVEAAPDQGVDTVDVEVVGYQFGWEFHYLNDDGETVAMTDGTLRVPEDTRVNLRVTSRDVWHNFGVPGLKVKSDAIPGEYTETWFIAPEAGQTYQANCYELCGQGHSYMVADVQVMTDGNFDSWYQGAQQNYTAEQNNSSSNGTATTTATTTGGHGG
jgi:cytochrome c oxidase subunit 2